MALRVASPVAPAASPFLPPPSKPETLLSVCIIARDEAANLPGCLASLEQLGEEVEVIVIDTGSTDDTAAIALATGAVVGDFAWCDDFAAARNAALGLARGRWVLTIDADERLTAEGAAAVMEHARRGEPALVATRILNLCGAQGDCSHLGTRMFPAGMGVRYAGRVHEVPKDPGGHLREFVLPGVIIEHLGYAPEVYEASGKAERNVGLLLAEVLESPDNPLLRLYLAQSLFKMELWQDALDHLRVCLHICGLCKPGDFDQVHDQALMHLVDLATGLGRFEMALAEAQGAIRRRAVQHPGFWHVLGRLQQKIDQHPMALASFHRAVALAGAPQFIADHAICTWAPHAAMADSLDALGREAEAALARARAREMGAPLQSTPPAPVAAPVA